MASVSMRFGAIITPSGAPEGSGTGSTNITNVTATAETLPEGSSATAAASLTESNLTLTFGIPTGATGSQGDPCTVAVGSVSTGATASVVNSGTASEAVLDFVLPQTQTSNNVQDTGNAGQIEFRLDANGKGEYRAVGASTWIPFLSGGSGPTYTRLWTNNSPTSNFAGQTVTLSQAANTFDAVRIVWAYNTSSGATADSWQGNTGAMPQWYQFGSAEINHASGGYLLIGVVFTQTNSYARRGYFTSDYTGLFISACQRMNASGNSNGNCIPLCVEGVTF